ncbi:Hsp70 family protein [Longispora sp. K20-0274]|uniref:Hsp70 family protein n=1 Tax=Longispora sp. K20-0274 TaxID=3088255 RepID=UPI003999B0D1
MGHRLGIDFGTSNTVAVLGRPDGQVRQLLFDGSPVLPSGVFTNPAGELLTGRDAAHSARLAPERFVPNPKRLLDDADNADRAVTLVAAVLHRVYTEAVRTIGGPPDEVVLTHPAGWGPDRLRTLADAALRAGLPTPKLAAEPVAAACYFTTVLRGSLARDGALVVYDFGGGTFDASVVGPGPTVLSAAGLNDVGGLDIDSALVEHLKGALPRTAEEWARLADPASASDRRLARQFLDDVRGAKEMLARTAQAFVYVPIIEAEAPIGREELDQLAGPLIDRTVEATREALVTARAEDPGRLAGVFLVGGSSRLPAVATLLHRAFGVAPTVLEQPELVVAEGSLVVPPDALTDPPTAAAAYAPNPRPATLAQAPTRPRTPAAPPTPTQPGSPARPGTPAPTQVQPGTPAPTQPGSPAPTRAVSSGDTQELRTLPVESDGFSSPLLPLWADPVVPAPPRDQPARDGVRASAAVAAPPAPTRASAPPAPAQASAPSVPVPPAGPPAPIWAEPEPAPTAYTLTPPGGYPIAQAAAPLPDRAGPVSVVLQLPSGPAHTLSAGSPRLFLGSSSRVYAFRAPDRLADFLSRRDWPDLVTGYPWASLPPAADLPPAQTVDLLGIGAVLAASCEPNSRPMHRSAHGSWEPVPADPTTVLAADALDHAVMLLDGLFAGRGRPSPLLSPERVSNSAGPVGQAAARAGRLSADVLVASLGAPHRYRATAWWWQLTDAVDLLIERR